MISEAKKAFEMHTQDEILIENSSMLPKRLLLMRKTSWDSAYIRQNSDSLVVFVPLNIAANVTVKEQTTIASVSNGQFFLRLINNGSGFIASKMDMVTMLPKLKAEGDSLSAKILLAENWFNYSRHFVDLSLKSSN